MKKRTKNTRFAKLKYTLLFLLSVIVAANTSTAFTTDLETSLDNTFQASTLDMVLVSNTSDFDPTTPLSPGDSSEREILVQNLGSLPFQYSQEFEILPGSDAALCNALQLEVDYLYYSAGSTLNTINKYVGSLSTFSINTSGSDADFDHPNSYPYIGNPEYADNEQWLVYRASLPASADPALQDLTCNFNIRAKAWQQDFAAYPQGFNDTEVLDNTISSGRWYIESPVNLGYNEDNGSADDYSIPRPSTEIACGGITNINGVSHHWTDVAGGDPNIKYQRQYQVPASPGVWAGNEIYANPYTNFRTFGGGIGTQGTYNSRVRAFYDENSNNLLDTGELSSDWSLNSCQITYDVTAPAAPLPLITNSPSKTAVEEIVNGGFESGLAGWDFSGDVVATGTDAYTSPSAGGQMAKIGVSSDPGNDISVNILSQEIPKGVRSIGFNYNFFSKDILDNPGMMVLVNGKNVQQVWASDLISSGSACHDASCSGWQHMNIYVGDVEEATLSIAFYAGNIDIPDYQSWVYIDEVSTSDVVVNGSALFELDIAQDAGTEILPYYQIGTDGPVTQGSSFTISSPPTGGIISYWSQDLAGNKSAEQTISVLLDNTAPSSITDLGLVLSSPIADLGTGEYELVFTAPADNAFSAVNEYEVRYASNIFDASVDWDSLQRADFVGMTGIYEAPRLAGEIDALLVQNLLAGQQYYFAVKSKDAAGNYSAISNIAGVNIGSTPVVDISDSPIVINEFIPNPFGSDTATMPEGEWVELYNNSNLPIDLANWEIRDADSNTILISSGNSDANLNPSDAGETVIPAFGYLVVYDNSVFSLNNDGDTVSLHNELGIEIDSYEYTGVVPEGKSIAREFEGVGIFIDPEPTPGRANAIGLDTLKPIVKLFKTDDFNASLSLFDAQAFESANYSVLYTHLLGGLPVKDALQGSVASIDSSRVDINNIYFGTCSELGLACIPHFDISDVSVGVELLKADGTTRTIETKMKGVW